MGKEKDPAEYLPLSESTYYILLALVEPMHGYGVMQHTEAITAGEVRIGPGTLYGAFTTLEREGLIRMESEENRRKVYQNTGKGTAVLQAQVVRLEQMLKNGYQILGEKDQVG